jgi:hypothetical protein
VNLRPNQFEPVQKGIEYFSLKKAEPSIIVAPTAFGKSIVIAAIAKGVGERILVIQPSKELLEQNYNKFIEFLKKVFKNNPDRLENLLHMYSETELGTELTIAPASGKLHFHSAYVGGYIDHVMNVCRNAYSLKKIFAEQGGRINFTDEELFFAALHHDLGKLGDGEKPHYIPEESEWHRKNQNSAFKINPELYYMDVTDRALWLLNQYGIKYSQN